jgi:hypothetical protein
MYVFMYVCMYLCLYVYVCMYVCAYTGWGLEHRASNPLSIKNLHATETSATVN